MSESEMLKPCPFCGSEAAVERFAEDWYDDESASYVRCTNQDCRASQWEDETSPYNKGQAITAWNTRAGEHAAYERGKAEGAEAVRGRIARDLQQQQIIDTNPYALTQSQQAYNRALQDAIKIVNQTE